MEQKFTNNLTFREGFYETDVSKRWLHLSRFCFRKGRLSLVAMFFLLWVFSGAFSFAQTMSVYPPSFNVTVANCNGSITKTFIIENSGADDLICTITGDSPSIGISLSEHADTIAPGATATIAVIFDAKGVAEGTHTGNITVSSNDPNNAIYNIAYSFVHSGNPVLVLSNTSFDYGNVSNGTTVTKSLWIYNRACGALSINDIQSTTAEFTVNRTSFNIQPYDSAEVKVSFHPASTGAYNGTLTITSNVPDTTITLTGNGIFPPVLSLSTDSISDTIKTCNGSVTKSFVLKNTGDNVLNYKIKSFGDRSNISTTYAGGNGASGNMFDVKALTNLRIDSFDVNCGSAGSVNIAIYYKKGSYVGYETNASAWTLLGTKTVTGNPSGTPTRVALGKLYIPEGETYGLYITTTGGSSLNYTNGANTYSDDNITVTTGVGKSYPLFGVTFTPRTWNGRIYYSVNNARLTILPQTGSLASGDSVSVNFSFNGSGLSSGVYSDVLVIGANDPANPFDTIRYTFIVSGVPLMNFTGHVNFGNVVSGASVTDTLWIRNKGCGVLSISNISGKNAAFSVSPTSFSINAYDSARLAITFAPGSTGAFKDTLIVTGNVPNDTIIVTGAGLEPPVLSVTPGAVADTVKVCDGTAIKSFTITNSGPGDLIYSATNLYLKSQVSDIYYTTTGETVHHLFSGLVSNADSISLTVTLNGDYTIASAEYATLVIEGTSYGIINTSDTPDGTDYTRSYHFSGNEVATWLSDGQLSVDIVNSGAVNPGYGDQLNRVAFKAYFSDFLTISPSNGVVAASASSNINVEFNAAGLTGIWKGNILVKSNDPVNTSDTIAYVFTVEGVQEMHLSSASFDFGNVINSLTATHKIWIRNTGCDTLKINDINISDVQYSVNDTNMIISPHDSAEVTVTFAPVNAGLYNDTLVITGNVENDTVFLSGLGIVPPVTSLSADTLKFSISGCGGSAIQTFTIENTGASDLTYNNKVVANTVTANTGNVLYSYANFAYYNTGMVLVGNYLYALNYNDGTMVKYDTITQQIVASYPIFSNPFGITYDGQYLWIGRESTLKIYNYDLSGNAIGNSITMPFSGLSALSYDGKYFVTAQYNASNPTVYKINHAGNVIATYSTTGISTLRQLAWVPEHSIGQLWVIDNVNRLRQFNISGGAASEIRSFTYGSTYIYSLAHDGTALLIGNWDGALDRVDDGITEGGGLSLSSYQGTVGAGASAEVTATIDGLDIPAGTYTGYIMVNSNDPVKEKDTIVCVLTVSGNPAIELSKTTVNFPPVMVNATSSGSINISNTGCDTLKITNITGSDAQFGTTTTTPLQIMPDESQKVYISFTPGAQGYVSGTITIYNNVKDTTINVTGLGITPSVVSVTSNTADGAYSEGDVVDLVVTFNNEMVVNTTGGTPRIELNTVPTAYAAYTSGSGSRDLVFQYTVGAADNSIDLDYASPNALSRMGGSIVDDLGNAPDTLLPVTETLAATRNIVIDNVHPTVSITSAAAGTTGKNPVPLTITFSEEVSGLTTGDIQVTNGTPSNLSTSDGITWSADITPASDGVITVNIAAGAAQDLARNDNEAATQFSIIYDHTVPVLTLTSAGSKITNSNPVVVSVTSNIPVSGLALADFIVTNGTASNLTVVTDSTGWTVNITPAADGNVGVELPVGAVANKGGVTNPENSLFSIVYDGTAPSVTVSSTNTNPTNVIPIAVTVVFSEKVTGFGIDDIAVGNGTASNLAASGASAWTFDITPSLSGIVTVDIAAGAAKDTAGNNSLAATRFSIKYDTIAPSVVISSTTANPTNVSPIPVSIAFSEEVTGFSIGDIAVGNGAASNLQTSDNKTWTVEITPAASGTVTVNVAANVASDQIGLGNNAAAQLSRRYDNVVPTVTLSSVTTDTTNVSPVAVSVVFSEVITGFTVSDITVGNGTASNLQTSDNKTWTVEITHAASGVVTVDVAAGVANDSAGNANIAAAQLSRIYDGELPVINPWSVTNITTSSIDAAFTSSKSGIVYYVVLLNGAAAPSASEIAAGTGSQGVAVIISGNKPVAKGVAATVTVSGLTPNTAYTVYAVAKDVWGNLSAIKTADFTVLGTGFANTRTEASVYPNPVSSVLNINVNAAHDKVLYGLYSAEGRKIAEGIIENGHAALNMESYAAGTYILRITTGDSQAEYKVVKQ